MAGLSPPIRKDHDLLASIRKAFGKLSKTPMPLDKRLEGLSETELGLVVQTAQFVKIAHSYGDRSSQPYLELTRSMYPKLPYILQNIIADVLKDAEPIAAKPNHSANRDELLTEVQDGCAAEEEMS